MKKPNISPELLQSFAACRGHFFAAALFSMGVNILFLVYPLYMLQVYGRVLSSQSEETLVMLIIAATIGLITMGALDVVRARVLTRASLRLDEQLAGRLMTALVDRGPQGSSEQRGQTLRDFDTVRQFVSSQGAHAIFDLPWAPIYMVVIFLLSAYQGWFAVIGALILIVVSVFNEYLTRGPLQKANAEAVRNYGFTDTSLRNAEVIQAMGMLPGLLNRWRKGRNQLLADQVTASDRAAWFSGLIRFIRLWLQVGILGLGAYLVIEEVINAGAMFVGLILLSRALAPIEQFVGASRSFSGARSALGRINRLLLEIPSSQASMPLPPPQGSLHAEGVIYSLPGHQKPILSGINFQLEPGEVLGLIGPSASGKSTLARLLVGINRPNAGHVRLDGADVYQWRAGNLGPYVGYLPQDIELFAGTVRDNICRFTASSSERIVTAAQKAGVHDLILHLPQGYETEIGDGGTSLSGGQRQRIGLARALFGEPRFIVLDEPNSNLDTEGEQALANTVAQLKAEGVTLILITHRPSLLTHADKILALKDGQMARFGPKDQVLAQLSAPPGGGSQKPGPRPPQSQSNQVIV